MNLLREEERKQILTSIIYYKHKWKTGPAILIIYFISLAYFKDNASFAPRDWSKTLLQEIANINSLATEFSSFYLSSQLRFIVAFVTDSALNQNMASFETKSPILNNICHRLQKIIQGRKFLIHPCR